jgi:membrane fusion protein, multidrug efflux system
MKSVKNILIGTFLVALAAVSIGFTLFKNKEKMESNLQIASQQLEAVSVTTLQVKKGTLERSFSATGTFAPKRELSLLSETSGRVTQLLVEKGDYIAENQLVAKIDEQVLRSQFNFAKTNMEKAKKDVERFENLVKGGGATEQQLDEAKLGLANAENQYNTIRKQLADAEIKSPISGKIEKKHVEKGTFLNVGSPLVDLVDVSSLKMLVKIDESQILALRIGQSVQIKTALQPNANYEGNIKVISEKADESKRYEVEIALSNHQKYPLKAGMYGEAFFDLGKQEDVLLLPKECIVGSLKNAKVYVVGRNTAENGVVSGDTDNGIDTSQKLAPVELRSIVVGTDNGNGFVPVLSGLNEGETVVKTGQINLQNGMKVKVIK